MGDKGDYDKRLLGGGPQLALPRLLDFKRARCGLCATGAAVGAGRGAVEQLPQGGGIVRRVRVGIDVAAAV